MSITMLNGAHRKILRNFAILHTRIRIPPFLTDCPVPDLVNRIQSVKQWGAGQLRQIVSMLNTASTVLYVKFQDPDRIILKGIT